jgi:predicted amidophosphoribosyltransferase
VRGGPHMRRLAEHCAAALAVAGQPAAVAPALRLAAGARDAVGLDAARRAANLAGHVLPDLAGAPPAGSAVVLLDDVLTTGATAAACIRALASIDVRVAAVLALTSPRAVGNSLSPPAGSAYRRLSAAPEEAAMHRNHDSELSF